MKPRKPIRRGRPPTRHVAPKKRNVKRRTSEFARCYGSKARVAFVAGLPCSVAFCDRTPCENAHSESGGASRKADADTVIPLCPLHHRVQHASGWEPLGLKYHHARWRLASATERAWQAHLNRGTEP